MKSIIHKINFVFLLIFLININNVSHSQDKTYLTPDVNVISVTPVQGSGISLDRVPSNVQNFGEESLSEKKNFSVVETLQ